MNGLTDSGGNIPNGRDHTSQQPHHDSSDRENGHTNGTTQYDDTNGHIEATTLHGSTTPIPVAICGMAMRLPGGIRDDAAFYKFLVEEGDARSVVPEDRYNVNAYYSPHGKPGTVTTKHGYFLRDVDLSQFDHSMFTISAAEAELVDPNQRLTLEVVREALEQAGESWRGKPIGTYVGCFTEDWQELHHKDDLDRSPYLMMGTLDFALANRISYEYDLRGPSAMYKTACSSAGMGLHQALEAIRAGAINAAVVAGTNLILAPGLTVSMSMLGALSPEGSSKSFDASADGYARGEAVTAIYIKRLDEALRDGNPIRAVIRSSAANADGRSKGGMANPNPDSHEAVIRAAYQLADLDMSHTPVFEAHGTGTPVGDPIEVEAIARCFGTNETYLGSVKPNMGHSEGAAALTSVIKAVLALEHRTIIPNIKFTTPNPSIPWESNKLVVPTKATPWPQGRAERMSVGSYGIGGSNTHFIVDSAASFVSEKPAVQRSPESAASLLLFSTARPEALKNMIQQHQQYVTDHPESLSDVAYTLSHKRESLKYRAFVVTDGTDTWPEPTVVTSQGPKKAAFVFTGQGSQWLHMGRDLIRDEIAFRDNIRSMDAVLQSLGHDSPDWSIEGVLCLLTDAKALSSADLSQPLCTAIQIALVDFLGSRGVTPSAVVGHSSGEIAAAYAAGALSKEFALKAAYYRGFVCRKPVKAGGMAAIGLGAGEVSSFLQAGVKIACENSSTSVTISGDSRALDGVMDAIKSKHESAFMRRLVVETAYHSDHMRLVGDEYRKLIAPHMELTVPTISFYSSVYGGRILTASTDFDAQYWQQNLENPVLFHTAVKALLRDCPAMIHTEIGPHSALLGPLRQIYQETGINVQYIPTLVRGQNDTRSILSTLGSFFTAGMSISVPSKPDQPPCVLTDLPAYPWFYERPYWAESRVMRNWRFRKHARHDLLGSRVLESTSLTPMWRNDIDSASISWLKDHCVGSDVVFPAAGYISMAGAAACQLDLAHDTHDYTVRDVILRQALVLHDTRREVATTLRPQSLTTSLDSDWYEFEICSYDGSSWDKHCSGLVKSGAAGKTSAGKVARPSPLPRDVSASRWYTTLSRVGLNYGPRFTGLKNITASVTERTAVVDIQDSPGDGTESSYPLHPTTLDIMLQSWTVAAFQGVYGDFVTKFLPTYVRELYVGDGTGQNIRVKTTTASHSAAAGRERAEGQSFAVGTNDELVLQLKGFQGTPLPSEDDDVDLTALQLQWKPDFSFLDAAKLTRPTYDFREQIALAEELYVMCALESQQSLLGVQATQPHFEKYRKWMESQVTRFGETGYPLVDTARAVAMTPLERQQRIPELLERCKAAGVESMAVAIWRTYREVANVFQGKTDFLDLLIHDGTLAGIYDWMNNVWDFSDFFQLLGHTQPQMRILEIGAGTGGLTAKILKQLQSEFGERLYLQYTFTDVSSGFFVAAQERFAEYQGMEYKVLDVSKDPEEQGFRLGEYDLIIASNVLHATPFLDQTLRNVRKLMHDQGRLFLQELSPITSSMVYIMGLFSGWWLGEADGRAEAPYLSPEDWHERLLLAGFNGCDSVTLDNERPYNVNANIVSRPMGSLPYQQEVVLLSGANGPHQLATKVETLLQDMGYNTKHILWTSGDFPTNDADVISFVDLDQPLLGRPSESDWTGLIRCFDSFQQATVLWLSHPAQISSKDPHSALFLGLARTVRSELATSLATLEAEDWTSPEAPKNIVDVFRKVQQGRQDLDSTLDPDLEYALIDGTVHVGRFHWYSIPKALKNTATPEPDTKALMIGKRGLLGTLAWEGRPLPQLAADDVQVSVRAVGMNFTDVLIAMGVVHGMDALGSGFDTFGLEGAGIVSNIGADVKHVEVGDRVMILGTSSTGLATEVQRPGRFTLRIPDDLTFEEAATMPSVYVTVLLGLVDKAQLEKDQSILIHAAAGGIGIAAIQVARWLGADIYCTVGSDDKAQFLVREFGIPQERIFHSRDTSFYDDLMLATKGVGVDCVLNSVSGELLHTTWECVAPNGCMVEIGKRDMIGRAKLALDKFEDNRTFFGIDVSRHVALKRTTGGRLMQMMLDLYKEGSLKPIHPITTFEAGKVEDAFRYMQQGTHIGKIVVTLGSDELPWIPAMPKPSFRPDRSYLLCGGMGGLGRAIAAWMARLGAKHIMFLSRSVGKGDDDAAFMNELELMGCKVYAHAGDVADEALVRKIVATAPAPIAGVMQMAMILRDMGILDMDLDTYQSVIRPRVQGTWNLHNALGDQPLDFFVLFSSICGVVGYYGQANYAASNTFMDAFVQYRQARGLAASVLDIGAVDDVGYISRTPAAKETMLSMSGRLITERDFLEALHLTIARSHAAPALSKAAHGANGICYSNPGQVTQALECRLPIADPQNNIIWKRDPRMAIYRNIEAVAMDGASVVSGMKPFLASMTESPRLLEEPEAAEFLAEQIRDRVATFLMRRDDEEAMDLSVTLSNAGVDSLVAIELRNWWKQNTGTEVSVLELMDGGSLRQLGELAARRLKDRLMA